MHVFLEANGAYYMYLHIRMYIVRVHMYIKKVNILFTSCDEVFFIILRT